MKKTMFLWMLCGLVLASCASPGKVTYLRDMEPFSLYNSSPAEEMKIKQNDRLKITVSSKNPELSAPFNLGVGGYRVNTDGEISTAVDPITQTNGYLVDHQGNIAFPILETLYVEGLTRHELSQLIKDRLKQEKLVNDAIVSVDILNFKIAVMGEVNKVGFVNAPDGKLTLFDAITAAGGLTNNASMGEVAVIRETGQGRRMWLHDLRKTEVFESPVFNLAQNDIVYVKPKAAPRSDRENRNWQLFSTFWGVGSTFLSVLILLRTYR